MSTATDYLKAHDAKLIADAKALCALNTTAEIRAWFDSTGRALDSDDNAYAAAFGCLQAIAGQLVRMAASDA